MKKDLFSIRKGKLEKWRERGVYPYGERFLPLNPLKEIKGNFSRWEGEKVRVAGRIMSIREHGKSTFMDIQDQDTRIQIYFKIDRIGENDYQNLFLLDRGDILGVEGEVFKTKTGEVTVLVERYKLLSKCLRPLPQEWYGFKDVEKRFRQRYLDLISNQKVKEIFFTRSKIIRFIRNYLEERGFMEVETPMMHPLPGGALAEPFITHHKALDIDLYLRIAPEIYLKKLVVGGMEKIFELNRCFRNEGISPRHNPEFTMLELYWAYADYEDLMKFTEEMIPYLVKEIKGTYKVTYQGKEIDFTPPWRRINFKTALEEWAGVSLEAGEKEVRDKARKAGLEGDTYRKTLDSLFKKKVLPHLIQPTLVVDYPLLLSPLAKRKDRETVERFQPVVAGLEIGNAYTELNDPFEQRERFLTQMEERKAGDKEAHPLDEDFLLALEYGMPPVAGLGIGIDRLVMILTDSPSIKEVIFFPLLTPE